MGRSSNRKDPSGGHYSQNDENMKMQVKKTQESCQDKSLQNPERPHLFVNLKLDKTSQEILRDSR